jgi:primosomal protein N''
MCNDMQRLAQLANHGQLDQAAELADQLVAERAAQTVQTTTGLADDQSLTEIAQLANQGQLDQAAELASQLVDQLVGGKHSNG